jgi:alcohol dehydrogenase (cytochrome c)
MRPQAVSEREAWQLIYYIRGVARPPGTHGDASAIHRVAEPLTGLHAVDAGRLLQARQTPEDWLMYSGAYDGWRYSPLKQVSAANVRQLRVQWILQLPGSEVVESTPLVVDGVMFVTGPPNNVFALDAGKGTVLWAYRRQLPDGLRPCCGLVNRGVAISGTRAYLATLDAHLVALDTKTGTVAWDVKLADYDAGYTATGAPLVIGGKVIVGIAGGEYGIRGFLDAYDSGSGRRLWRFNTIPGPGEAGHDSWGGESWKTGGAPTWLTGAYDPELGLVYWGVGNPGPNYDGHPRPGNNLYSNSVVALDVTSGMLRWHFQFTPHDEHDWDAVQIPVLVDRDWRGTRRHLMLWANRNGFYYVLDRATGEFLLAQPFVRQSWADHIDASGRPILRPNTSPTGAGTLVYPGVVGGTNWWSPAYSPQTGYLYVPVLDEGGIFLKQEAVTYRRGEPFVGSTHQGIPEERGFTAVRAIHAETGEVAWDHRFESTPSRHLINGVMATGGGLVFGSDGSSVVGLDAVSGRELWRFQTGGQIWAAPIAYEVGGTEIVAVAAGSTIIAFGLK